MRKLLAFLLGCVPAMAGALQGPYECQYGVACQVPFELYEPDGVLPYSGVQPTTSTDFWWHCPATSTENKTGVFSSGKHGTFGFFLTLGTTDTQCDRIKILIRDEDGPGTAYLSTGVAIETCGNVAAARPQCRSGLSSHAATDIVTGGAIATTGGAVDNVTTVATTVTNTDMRGTDNASTHAATAIVTGGAINTSGGVVTTVATAQTAEALGATAQSNVTAATKQALADYKLDQLSNVAWDGTMAAGSVFGALLEDVGGLRYTGKALEQAPSGSGSGDVTSWNGVPLSTTNPLPNAAPGTNGGLPTVNVALELAQQVEVARNNDKGGYIATVSAYDGGLSFNANQEGQINAQALAAIDSRRLNELASTALTQQPAPGSIYGDLTQDSVAQPGTQQFTADALAQAPTASSLDAEALRLALGGFSGLITTVVDDQNFILDNGPAAADSINDEFTAIFEDTSDGGLPVCHRQVRDWTAGAQLTINKACPAAYTQVPGDRVIILPNGAGDLIATVNVNNGQVEVDQTQLLETGISAGCAQAAILAVQTGRQIVTAGPDTIYEYQSRDGLTTRVEATRTVDGRSQALITCPPGL